MRTPSPSWCGLDRTHLWPTGSSLGDPLITARNFSSCPSDSISRWTPCPPETASGGFRSALAVSDFRLRARLDVSIPSTSPASEAFNPAFGYSAPHPSTGGTSTLLINALLSAHHGTSDASAQDCSHYADSVEEGRKLRRRKTKIASRLSVSGEEPLHLRRSFSGGGQSVLRRSGSRVSMTMACRRHRACGTQSPCNPYAPSDNPKKP